MATCHLLLSPQAILDLDVGLVEALVQAGASPRTTDAAGNTALHVAVLVHKQPPENLSLGIRDLTKRMERVFEVLLMSDLRLLEVRNAAGKAPRELYPSSKAGRALKSVLTAVVDKVGTTYLMRPMEWSGVDRC